MKIKTLSQIGRNIFEMLVSFAIVAGMAWIFLLSTH